MEKKLRIILGVMIGVIILLIIVLSYLNAITPEFFDKENDTSELNDSKDLKIKEVVEQEIGLDVTIDSFLELPIEDDYMAKLDIDITNCEGITLNDFNEVGIYDVKITDYINNKIYKSKLRIVDTKPPVAKVKNLTIEETFDIKPEDFIEFCEDNSGKECIVNFKEAYDLSKDKQEIALVVSDNSDNISEYLVVLNRIKNNVVVTFDCDCDLDYQLISLKKGQKVSKPQNPTKNNGYFEEWTLNGNTFDFNKPIMENITLKAKFTKAKWNILWIILAEVDYNGYNTKISMDSFEKYKITGKYFEDFVESNVPSLDIVNNFVYDSIPLKNISTDSTYRYFINKNDALLSLKRYNYQSYDSVILIANMTPFRAILPYAGLTWSSQRYSFIPDYNHLAGKNNSHDVFIHEWLHQIEYYYGNTLGFNVPNLHDNATYGFYQENERGWRDWYAAYLSNNLKGGPSTGINKNWWKQTPISKIK